MSEYLCTKDVPLADLIPFPGNARRGDVESIRSSLRRNGQYRSLVVRDTPGGGLVVLAGNHTLKALAAEGADTARCEVIECDDLTASRINLADNRTPELGGYDNEALLSILDGLAGDFDGSGWTDDAVVGLDSDDVPDFQPVDPRGQPRLDRSKTRDCPSCGYQWFVNSDGNRVPASKDLDE